MTGLQYEVTPGPPSGFQPPTPPEPKAQRSPNKVGLAAVGVLASGTVAAAILLPLYLHASDRAAYYEQSRDEALADTKTVTEIETIVKTETQLQTETQVQTETVTVEPPPPPEPEGPKTTFGSGTYQVNIDIASGTYAAPGGSNCYWERLSGLSGDFDDIITNDWTQGGQVYVTIQASDMGFKTDGCGQWTVTE